MILNRRTSFVFIQSLRRSRYFSSEADAVPWKGEGKRWAKKIFSGIQPTGGVHLGNYFGAIRRWVDYQDAGERVILSVVDLHSITLPQDPATLRKNILEMTATLLACGVDPQKSVLFLQSLVPRHAELAWILTCITTMARISHLPQYKEKSEGLKEAGMGLLMYPVLQAADILLYRGTDVPVGEDQLQQLQMAQQLVKTFNHRFGLTFPSPQAVLAAEGVARLKSLRDPSKKMSKSDSDPKSRILLTDTPEIIAQKIKKAVTDFNPKISYDPESRPGISNLIQIHCLVADKIPEEICEEAESLDTVGWPNKFPLVSSSMLSAPPAFRQHRRVAIIYYEVEQSNIIYRYKRLVAQRLGEHIDPIRKKIEENLSRPQYLMDVLEYGAAKARVEADQTYQEVCQKVGIGLTRTCAEKLHVLNV